MNRNSLIFYRVISAVYITTLIPSSALFGLLPFFPNQDLDEHCLDVGSVRQPEILTGSFASIFAVFH